MRELDLLPWPRRIILSVAWLLIVGGCTDTYISQSGPSRTDLVNKARLNVLPAGPEQVLQYALVPLNRTTVALLGADEDSADFPNAPTEQRAADGLIGIGDQISITVFESGSGGLFLPREGGTRAGNFVTIPTQQVGKDGAITMPYAGTLRVAGSSP
jgi:polysaccharide export outer membrane protein